MKVHVIDYTRDADRTVAVAARLCYSPSSIEDIGTRMDESEVVRMVHMLRERGHMSPFEHAYFVVGIEGLSRTASHQLVRSRIASYSQQSQRYIDHRDFPFVTPPSIKKDPRLHERYREHLAEATALYRQLCDAGVPKEDARFVLPNATATSLVMSKNARAWLEWFEVRMCTRAQWEIRVLAHRILRQLRRLAPEIFEVAGPPCMTEGICREGTDSCGRIDHLVVDTRSFRMARLSGEEKKE